MDNTIIETIHLSKYFNKGKNNEIKPLDDINIKIKKNTCNVLIGPSGSGKSTLLSILSCLAKPSKGEYVCLNQKVSHWSEKFLTKFRRENIGMIFQNFQLINGLSSFDNIASPLIPLKLSSRTIKKKVEKSASLVNINHKLQQKVDTLSGGEMQRVAIARALVNDPKIIFADEPTAHLDRIVSQKILDVFTTLKKTNNTTLIITTHDTLVENHPTVDRKILIKDGRIEK